VLAVINRYDNPFIWVLENGISEKGEAQRTGDAALQDPLRTQYFHGYISETCRYVGLAWGLAAAWHVVLVGPQCLAACWGNTPRQGGVSILETIVIFCSCRKIRGCCRNTGQVMLLGMVQHWQHQLFIQVGCCASPMPRGGGAAWAAGVYSIYMCSKQFHNFVTVSQHNPQY